MNSTLNRVSIETSSVLTGGAERSFVSGLMDLGSTLKGEKASEEKPWAGVAPVAIGDSSDIERVLQGSGIDRDDYESILNSYRTSSV